MPIDALVLRKDGDAMGGDAMSGDAMVEDNEILSFPLLDDAVCISTPRQHIKEASKTPWAPKKPPKKYGYSMLWRSLMTKKGVEKADANADAKAAALDANAEPFYPQSYPTQSNPTYPTPTYPTYPTCPTYPTGK